MENIETVASFALSRIFRYEPRLAKAIVETLGSAEAIFRLDKDGLFEALGPFNKYREPIAGTSLDKASQELDDILKDGYSYIPHCHPDFPRNLSFCEDAPVGFFLRSDDSPANIFSGDRISIVGTRDITPYGKEWCKRLATALAETEEKPAIVSGLAYGVDINAHIGALENGLRTISVLGNGIGSIYPAMHASYADRICHTPGCGIITEYPPGADVTATNFLCRNRIIAGMSRATILVESKLRGGGMTTARQASSYSRDVFAIPGRSDDVFSQGCNCLIQSRLAEPIISVEEFISSLGYRHVGASGKKTAAMNPKDYYSGSMDTNKIDAASRILLMIRGSRGIAVSEIAASLRLPYHEVIALVTRLEGDGFIEVDILQRCSIKKNA